MEYPNDTQEETFARAMELITTDNKLPAELKDAYAVYDLISQNRKLEELDGQTVTPLLAFYNKESYKNEETEELEQGEKTYFLCRGEDGTFQMYNGFSVTFRLKMQLLQYVFKEKLPKITIAKVSKGKKQEYTITPIKEK